MFNMMTKRGGARRAALRSALLVFTLLPLSACSTTQLAGLTSEPGSAPAQERVGAGTTTIGLLSSREPDNLSDGAEDSIHLAAKLAITSLNKGLATLEIRSLGPSDQSARQAAATLANTGAKIVITGGNQATSNVVAKVLGAKGIPTMALAAASDTGAQLYGAGLGTRDELSTLMAEFKRRGFSQIAMAVTPHAASQTYAAAILSAAASAEMTVSPVDASSPAVFLEDVATIAQTARPDAIVFATGPARAGELVGPLRAVPAYGGIAIVGNASWAMAEPLGTTLSGAWYSSLPRDGLASFAKRFKAAYGRNPTLTGAVVYDLIILAAALPEAVPDTPYAPDILRSQGGFDGFSGPFRFGAANLAELRDYTIVTAR